MTGKMTPEEREQACKALSELMDKFNEYRAKWIEKFGTDDGFGDWFWQQAAGNKQE